MSDMLPGWDAGQRLEWAWYRLGMAAQAPANWLLGRYQRAWFRHHPDPEGGRPGADLGEWGEGDG